MNEYRVSYLSPNGTSVVEDISADDPDDVCHQLTQRYGTEWKLLGCPQKKQEDK